MDKNSEAPARTLTAMDEAANRGVDMLDTIRPEWRIWVDFDALNMSDPEACIVGQIGSMGYFSTLKELMADALLAGFDNDTFPGSDQSDNEQLFDTYNFAAAFGFDHFAEHDATYTDAKTAWMRAL